RWLVYAAATLRAVAAATTGVAVVAYLKPRLDRALGATVGPLEPSGSAPRPQLARGPTSRDEAVGALRARQPRRRLRVGLARLLLLLRRRAEDRLRHRALALVPPTSSSRRSGRQRPPPLRSRRRDADGRHAAPSAVPCAQRQTACAGRIAEHLTHA